MPPRSKKFAKITRVAEVPFGAQTVGHYRLGNGLTVYLLSDFAAPVVSCQSWFGVGSSHEKPKKTGLAHLFEHLMFKATSNRASGEFDRMLELAGAEANAATWTDWTYYYENLPASELELALDLESDRLSNLLLSKEQVDSEREVVLNERRYTVDDDIEGSVGEALYGAAFSKHPYGWPTIGFSKDIEAFTLPDCRAFYKRYYAPNNCTIVIGGAVAEREALEMVQHYYGGIKPSELKHPALPKEPAQKKERRLELPCPTESEKISVGYRAPAYDTKDHVALSVLNEILVSGRSSRLFRRFVADLEISTGPAGAITPFREPGLYDFWVSARDGIAAERLLEVFDEEIDRICKALVTADEMEKAKNRAELSFLVSLETVSGKAESIGFAASVVGSVEQIFARAETQRKVTRDDLRRVANKYLKQSQRTVMMVRCQ